jgi:hypothetical protein
VNVSAVFGDVVVVLVAAVDRAVGLRHRVDVVITDEHSLALTKVESVLNLRCELR